MFTDSNHDIFDEVTNPHLDSAISPEDLFKNEYLIVVRKGKKVVLTFSPRRRNVTLGRSRKNCIVLSDPAFPRRAGEIILGPVPHYRNADKDSDSKAPTPMLPGKEYPFPPYTVRLMEPGDILVNRAGPGKKVRLACILFSGAIMLTTAMWSIATWHTWKGNVPESSTHATLVEEKKERSPNSVPDSPVPENIGENGFSEMNTEETNTSPKATPMKREQPTVHDRTPSKNIRARRTPPIVTEKISELSDKVSDGIQAREFEVILSRVKVLLEDDRMVEAFRVVNPIVPLTNEDQRVQIIETIEPLLHEMFRRAYMIKNYERAESTKILNEIVTYQLEFLPAWQKAKKLLDVMTTVKQPKF